MNNITLPEKKAIHTAADKIHTCISHGRRAYFFGAGHAYQIEQEQHCACFALLPENEFAAKYLFKSPKNKKTSKYIQKFLELYAFQKGDVIVIAPNSGYSALAVELSLHLKEKGAAVIAITDPVYSRSLESRHISKKRLYQTADIVLNNREEYGDCFILHCLIASFIQKQFDAGIHCPIFKSRREEPPC